jgi:uncharacterized protein with PIN domain
MITLDSWVYYLMLLALSFQAGEGIVLIINHFTRCPECKVKKTRVVDFKDFVEFAKLDSSASLFDFTKCPKCNGTGKRMKHAKTTDR